MAISLTVKPFFFRSALRERLVVGANQFDALRRQARVINQLPLDDIEFSRQLSRIEGEIEELRSRHLRADYGLARRYRQLVQRRYRMITPKLEKEDDLLDLAERRRTITERAGLPRPRKGSPGSDIA